jgi:L-ribulose-5-phosphate 3-epimerase
MTRRNFLQTAATAAALSPLANLSAQDAPKKSPWKKAVNLGMAKADGASMTDRFKMIKDAGFDGVELNRPDAIPIEDLIKAREATGLEIAGIICSTHWGKPITHQDPAVREQGMRGLKLSLQEAGELGCKRLLLVPGVVSKEVSYADAYKRSQAGIREAIPVAEKAGCKIAVENVWNQFLLSPLEAARFVDELDSPWVGWHFDIGNVVTFGWPEQWIRTLGPRILNIHIKEYSRKKRDQAGPYKGFEVELGEGDVGWPDVVKALNDVAYKGYAVLEVPGGDATRLKFLAERTDKILTS